MIAGKRCCDGLGSTETLIEACEATVGVGVGVVVVGPLPSPQETKDSETIRIGSHLFMAFLLPRFRRRVELRQARYVVVKTQSRPVMKLYTVVVYHFNP